MANNGFSNNTVYTTSHVTIPYIATHYGTSTAIPSTPRYQTGSQAILYPGMSTPVITIDVDIGDIVMDRLTQLLVFKVSKRHSISDTYEAEIIIDIEFELGVKDDNATGEMRMLFCPRRVSGEGVLGLCKLRQKLDSVINKEVAE